MWSLRLVMSECSLCGRGRGHVSNFYIVDLENFATASRRYTGDIHNLTVGDLFMTPMRQWKRLVCVTVECTCLLPTHIEHIIKKATTRLYFLNQLRIACVPNSHFYITVIRPVLEYRAPVWHYALTKAQSESLEAVQKRAIHITHNLTAECRIHPCCFM